MPLSLIWAIPICKTLVIWASPSHITLAIRVRVTGDAHITGVLGIGMPPGEGDLGCPYRRDTAFIRIRAWEVGGNGVTVGVKHGGFR